MRLARSAVAVLSVLTVVGCAAPAVPDEAPGDGGTVDTAVDRCPGFDDSIDTDGDGIPDGCDEVAAELWAGLGGSDFGPWSTFVRWGSAAGAGISVTGPRPLSIGAVVVGEAGSAYSSSIALDGSGRPVIAYTFMDTDPRIRVKRFDGSAWVDVGAPLGFLWCAYPQIAVAPDGNPVVAWTQIQGLGAEVVVARFDGASWVTLPALRPSGTVWAAEYHGDPALALDAAGRPVIAWSRRNHQAMVTTLAVARFNGTAWVDVGGSSTAGIYSGNASYSYRASVALDGAGHPVVAWAAGPEIYVKRFDGSAWGELGTGSASGGGISDNAGVSGTPQLALDALGRPTVAWKDDTSGVPEIYVKQFDGSAWAEVGTGAASGVGISASVGTGADFPRLALDGADLPVVAWADGSNGAHEIFAKRFDGTRWVEVADGAASGGGMSGDPFASTAPAIAVDAAGGLVVSWTDSRRRSGGREILVKRLDGTAWAEVGSATAVGGALSDSPGHSSQPTLGADASGQPIVSYLDDSSGGGRLVVARFDGAAWSRRDVGGPRAPFFGGSVAFDAAGEPVVAWSERYNNLGHNQIMVSRYDGSAWVEVGAGSMVNGGISNSTRSGSLGASCPALALDPAGFPVVAYIDDKTGSFKLHVSRFDGTGWVSLGVVADGRNCPTVAVDASGVPTVAWVTPAATVGVARYQGGAWVGLGSGLGSGTGPSTHAPKLVLDGSGAPVVAWLGSGWELHVKRFDGSAWSNVGAGSVTGRTLPNRFDVGFNVVDPVPFSMALRGANPVITWHDRSSGNDEVYVRHFDGAAWADLGTGSSAGGGVSNSQLDSMTPGVVIADGRPCVAWVEEAASKTEIVLRCANIQPTIFAR